MQKECILCNLYSLCDSHGYTSCPLAILKNIIWHKWHGLTLIQLTTKKRFWTLKKLLSSLAYVRDDNYISKKISDKSLTSTLLLLEQHKLIIKEKIMKNKNYETYYYTSDLWMKLIDIIEQFLNLWIT